MAMMCQVINVNSSDILPQDERLWETFTPSAPGLAGTGVCMLFGNHTAQPTLFIPGMPSPGAQQETPTSWGE